MYLRTISWSVVSSKNNIYVNPAIQIFCIDVNGSSCYVRLEAVSTVLLEFKDVITEDDLKNINDEYQPKDSSLSLTNDYAISLRGVNINKLKYTDYLKDSQGLLSSFWEARNIKPYSWIYIKEYEFLTNKYTIMDIELLTKEEFIYPVEEIEKFDFSTRKLFFDIEVISHDRNFTDAKVLSHEIFMISVVSEINNVMSTYILITKNTDTFKEAEFLIYKTEKDMIIGFFDLWREINPDRTINYNGDSYDMPYILKRCKLLKITVPSLSKLLSPSIVMNMKHPSPVGYEWSKTILSPGVEKLDLITYFRRFYPGNVNYRLETTGKLYIDEGKSGLEIEEMFRIIESNDPVQTKKVSWYSYKDSILLYNLWNKLDIENKIEDLCNDIYCTIEELLRLDEEILISRMFYHIDYSTSLIGKMGISDIKFLKPFDIKSYKNLYYYKYDEIFNIALSILNEIEQYEEYLDKIIDRIKYLPTYMKAMVIYSNYLPSQIQNNFEELLDGFEDIIAIDGNYIYSSNPNIEELILIGKYDNLFVLTKSSMIQYNDGVFTRIGLHKICRPKYEYMKIAVDSYLLDYINGKKIIGQRTTVKELSKMDKNLFIINTKVKPLYSYKDKNGIKHKMAKELTDNDVIVTSWISIKYVYSDDEFTIINKDSNIDKISLDYKKYSDELNEIYKTLDKIIK